MSVVAEEKPAVARVVMETVQQVLSSSGDNVVSSSSDDLLMQSNIDHDHDDARHQQTTGNIYRPVHSQVSTSISLFYHMENCHGFSSLHICHLFLGFYEGLA